MIQKLRNKVEKVIGKSRFYLIFCSIVYWCKYSETKLPKKQLIYLKFEQFLQQRPHGLGALVPNCKAQVHGFNSGDVFYILDFFSFFYSLSFRTFTPHLSGHAVKTQSVKKQGSKNAVVKKQSSKNAVVKMQSSKNAVVKTQGSKNAVV